MLRSICCAFACLCHPLFLSAQGYTTIKTAAPKAISAFNEGLAEAQRGEPAIAQGYFEKALRLDPDFIDAKLSLADNHAELRDFFKAEKAFEEALALDSTYAPAAFYWLGKAEWELDKYAECAAHLAAYLRLAPSNARNRPAATRLFANARFAAQAVLHPQPFDPQPVGDGINTAADEYFPSLTADGETLIFTRNQKGNEDFYRSVRKDGVWQKAEPLEGVNTLDNEGAQSISPDGSWLVFTACNRDGDGSQGRCDLYWSQLKSTGWTKPVPFSASINSPDWDAQPSIGADNKTLIFSSNRPGGRGSIDLWQTSRLPGGKWAKPENLGPVNTGGKDHTPFFHPDGQTLYFASDSLPGMGGNDLFVTRRQPDGTWGTPENLGWPINTKGEEGMLTVSLDGRTAYYATNRPSGRGGIDIYTFALPESARPQLVTYVKAQVTDAATGYPIGSARAEFTDLKTGKPVVSGSTKPDGIFLVCLPAGRDYALNVNREKYLFYSDQFNLAETANAREPFLLNIELQPIAPNSANTTNTTKPIVLRNVLFETGSAELRPESLAELERLAALLSTTPSLRIQINGHTDDVGNDISNQNLSEQRAKSVHDYLISKGIDANRLRWKGFGESQPIAPEDRTRNRRTEFVVW
jgi:outer membrane protein OmpA-like peptidoglycan-associated protein